MSEPQAGTRQEWKTVAEATPEVAAILNGASRITCLAHKDADADSLGSALGFAMAASSHVAEVAVVVPNPMPRLLSYLPGYSLVTSEPVKNDIVFTFDCPSVERFGDKGPIINAAKTVICIDHHRSNTSFGTLNIVEPTASATGQMVFRLLQLLKLPITAQTASCLYAALYTDTGGFRHENTTEEALRNGADLVGLGADAGYIALKSYKSRTVEQMRLEALAVSTLRGELGGRLIWSAVTTPMLVTAGADLQDAEGIIDQLQSIDTMKLAILFKEVDLQTTKISVRSRDEIDATAVCTPFGGGGHLRAAGAELRIPIKQAQQDVLAVARNVLGGE